MLVTQSCPTLCDPMDCNPSGSSVHGILQARILERVAIPMIAYGNGVRFMISKEDLTSGPGTRLDHSRTFVSDQIRSVAMSCPTLCDPMNRSTPGLPVHHQLPEFTETHVHRVSDAIQPSHPLSSPSPPAPNPSQHQSLFQ